MKEFDKYEPDELPKCKRCKNRTSILVGKEQLCMDCCEDNYLNRGENDGK